MKRKGFTFIEVAFATIIVAVGILLASRFFTVIYEQIIPYGQWGGLRRYIIAEEMLKAQAEGLRILRHIFPNPASCKLVGEPAGSGYQLQVNVSTDEAVTRFGTDGASSFQQLTYFDLDVSQQGLPCGTLSLSTLRSTVLGQNEKIGL